MHLNKISILTIALMGSAAFAGSAATTFNLEWMAGKWVGTYHNAPMEAYYSGPQGGMIIGLSKVADPKAVYFFEFEKIQEIGGSLVLQPFPFANAGVQFPLKEMSEERVVFENPDHDFPKRIIYQKMPNDQLLGRIEGIQNGQPASEDFIFDRAQ
jgi:hypothetical protein